MFGPGEQHPLSFKHRGDTFAVVVSPLLFLATGGARVFVCTLNAFLSGINRVTLPTPSWPYC